MAGESQVSGQNAAALFTLKVHRGDGMALLAMNWKNNERPPNDFVGFAIEYKEPDGDRFFVLKNRLGFRGSDGALNPNMLTTRLSPIQKFRWVHFPRNADMAGEFVYRVTPVFMNDADELSYGEPQEVGIELRRETFAGQLNVTFTRGFVSSQAFVDRFISAGPINTLLPRRAADGLTFTPTHPKTDEALKWMGFEAREAILDVLDRAIADDQAQVRVVAYDLSEPGIVTRLEKLKGRLKIIVDDSDEHGEHESGETQAAARLVTSAGAANVKRHHMLGLQHNKTIVVDGPNEQLVVCGSTNYSWRGFFVQANNAVVLKGSSAVKPFLAAFDEYFSRPPGDFRNTPSATWCELDLDGIDAKVAFSPHGPANALLSKVGDDIKTTGSSLFYSLAFLAQTGGPIPEAIEAVTNKPEIFVYGMADKPVGGLDLQTPDGNVAPVSPATLSENVPEPFSLEPAGGGGIRLHHKFVVIDFDQPEARVYLGSYNFSPAADDDNGENLVLIRDRRVAVSYVVEAVRIFDHYQFRIRQRNAEEAQTELVLAKPPRQDGEQPWWVKSYTVPVKIRDRLLFA